MKTWVYNPHAGGTTIPPAVRERTEQRVRDYAEKHYGERFTRLDIRFRGALCYIDAFVEPPEPGKNLLKALGETRSEYFARMRSSPIHLVRLRYRGNEEAWSLAFYTYSQEKYEPTYFPNGTATGTPEEAFDVGAVYLQG